MTNDTETCLNVDFSIPERSKNLHATERSDSLATGVILKGLKGDNGTGLKALPALLRFNHVGPFRIIDGQISAILLLYLSCDLL